LVTHLELDYYAKERGITDGYATSEAVNSTEVMRGAGERGN
jgi:hypothetical protein